MPEGGLLQAELRLAGRLDERFFRLLAAIDSTGSINRAARAAGYTYKGAWLLLETAQNLARAPLLHRMTGGPGGGGTALTDEGQALLAAWRQMQVQLGGFVREQEAWLRTQHPALAGLLRRLSMKASARNQFAGTVSAVEMGPVTTQATVELPGGQCVTATLTTSAAKRLKLWVGSEAIALVKASEVVLVTDFAGYVLSARNQFAGTVSHIEKGAVSCLVGLTLPGGAMVSATVTHEAVAALGLRAGQPATAVFKAHAVMLAVPQP